MSQEQVEIHSLRDLADFAFRWNAEKRKPRHIVLLSGPMGVGKTQFVTYLAKALGIEDTTSPSFSLHNCYEGGEVLMDHIDLYRLEDEDDLETTGFWDLFSKDEGLIVIEWADRLDAKFLPPHWEKTFIRMEFTEPNGEKRRLYLGK